MVDYFGVHLHNTSKGFKLTKENYIPLKWDDLINKVYPENNDWCTEFWYIHIQQVLINYFCNIKKYKSGSREVFEEELNKILFSKILFSKKYIKKFHQIKIDIEDPHPEFDNKLSPFFEIHDLSCLKQISGIYILVMDEYKQLYLGQSHDIRRRILSHWSKQKSIERLLFDDYKHSGLSVDSFRAFDTTRIFVLPCNSPESIEDDLLKTADVSFTLNRIGGGLLSSDSDTLNALEYTKNKFKRTRLQDIVEKYYGEYTWITLFNYSKYEITYKNIVFNVRINFSKCSLSFVYVDISSGKLNVFERIGLMFSLKTQQFTEVYVPDTLSKLVKSKLFLSRIKTHIDDFYAKKSIQLKELKLQMELMPVVENHILDDEAI